MTWRSFPDAPAAASAEPVEIFRAGWQGVKVRLVQALGLLVIAPAGVWGAVETARGDELAGLTRYGVAVFLLVIAVGAAAGMVVYGGCYISRAVWDEEAGCCRVTLASLFVPTHLDLPGAISPRASYHPGESHDAGMRVNAPWYLIRVPGRRLPLILDAQGEILHPPLVERVLLGR